MTTLREIKKQQGFTNAYIGRALGVSPSVVSMILQGRHIHVYHDEQIQQLANTLNITFERCWYAMQESYAKSMKRPAPQYRADQLRESVQGEMQEQFLSVEVEQARQLATVESFVVLPVLQLE